MDHMAPHDVRVLRTSNCIFDKGPHFGGTARNIRGGPAWGGRWTEAPSRRRGVPRGSQTEAGEARTPEP
jgi:hypothetical protein